MAEVYGDRDYTVELLEPTRDMTGPQAALAGTGMILGGMGLGVTGQPNEAAAAVNNRPTSNCYVEFRCQ